MLWFHLNRGFAVPAALLALALGAAPASAQILNFTITMDGGQEVGPVVSPGTGSGTATLNLATNLFSWNVTFSGLVNPPTLAHFHAPAPQCQTANVAINLTPVSPIVGQQTVSAAQATQIRNGLWYVNIHTGPNPGGEIRGQVMPSPLDDPIPASIPLGPETIQLELVSDGMTAPNWGAAAPGQPGRLFVVDQNGPLWAVNLSTGQKSMFLDVSSRLVPLGAFGPGSFDERGFLGVAFHPNYATNGRLYTFTSEPITGTADFPLAVGVGVNNHIVIAEWTVPDPTNPASVVNPASVRVLMRIADPQFNHNAGALNFGPDGLLYIAVGDGGAADDQGAGHACNGNAQAMNTPLGKILRIDPLGATSPNGQYGIPVTNPFFATPGAVREIWALGLRNPFRFSFDSATGDLWAGDVGQNDIEEVNIIESGDNLGWNHKEGSFFFVRNGSQAGYVTDQPLQVPAGLVDPVAQYDHDEGISVIGGFVYHGKALPSLAGRYVFGEFGPQFDSDGRLFYLDSRDTIREFIIDTQTAGSAPLGRFLLGFGQDADGELYVMTNTTGVPFDTTGAVFRIVPVPSGVIGDLDGNGVVNGIDLGILLNSWSLPPGSPGCGGARPCSADLNGNGSVDGVDLGILLNNWTL